MKTGKPRAPAGTAHDRTKVRKLARAGALMREVDIVETATAHVARPAGAKPKKAKASTREGKTGVVLYVLPEVAAALRRLAALHNSDVQSMGRQALELLFAEYGETLPSGDPARSATS